MSEKIYYNSAILNKITDKKSDKAPDYRANVTIDDATLDAIVAHGGKVSIAGWLREGKNGKFVSLLLSADTYVKPAQENAKANAYVDDSEDVPF